MNKSTLLKTVLLLLLPFCASAQDTLHQERPMPRGDAPSIISGNHGNEATGEQTDVELTRQEKLDIESDLNKVLYAGVETPVKLFVRGYDLQKCTARLLGDGTLSGKDGHYLVKIPAMKDADIEIAFDDNGTEKILTRMHYKAVRLPDPVMTFGQKKSGNISKEELRHAGNLTPTFPELNFTPSVDIISYSLTVVPKDGAPSIFNLRSAKLPENVQLLFKDLPAESTIFFDDVKVKCEGDTKERNLRGVVLTVKA